MITGIICEYNPLHLGHKKQIDWVKARDPEGLVVCLMSGNYVQRGKPAIFDKMLRARAAVECGADLVLELPLPYCLSSAEGFAAGGVSVLGKFCDRLCFGAETDNVQVLQDIAQALLSKDFKPMLTEQLENGLSFPAARQAALERMGQDASVLSTPNNILAVEYCKAIIAQGCSMKPMAILRQGDYHDPVADRENPSATAVRALMENGGVWADFVPSEAHLHGNLHTLEQGERAILAKLRTMTDEEFAALPYGSEGLWRKLMHESRQKATLEEILTSVKSKRYTRTRLDRMIMCAFLGLTEQDLNRPVPYVRVLGFNDRGRQVLKLARQTGEFYNIGQTVDHPYQALETRAGRLYGLFAAVPEAPDVESQYRVYYKTGID
ncbi:MAG: nucleotidyltransferase family protein [Oscillospiraceae bacterium]|nr:nucleotidyltransferase family protein [Oscillospiraceae bacterium]